jgi:hypothetical protein
LSCLCLKIALVGPWVAVEALCEILESSELHISSSHALHRTSCWRFLDADRPNCACAPFACQGEPELHLQFLQACCSDINTHGEWRLYSWVILSYVLIQMCLFDIHRCSCSTCSVITTLSHCALTHTAWYPINSSMLSCVGGPVLGSMPCNPNPISSNRGQVASMGCSSTLSAAARAQSLAQHVMEWQPKLNTLRVFVGLSGL